MSTSANRNNAVLSECTAAGDQCHRERQTRGGESLPRHATDALDEENEEGYESFSPVAAGGRSLCLTLQASALAPSERYIQRVQTARGHQAASRRQRCRRHLDPFMPISAPVFAFAVVH